MTSVSSSTGSMAIGGIVSGLDTESIISQLEQVERQPITLLQNQETTLNTQAQAWNTANTRLLALGSAAKSLSSLASTNVITASSSESSLGASAGNSAVVGDYSFTVETVASYHQLTSQAYTSTDTPLGTGAITISANNKSIDIPVSDTMTLEDVRDAINAQTDVGVKAMIVTDGGDNPVSRLILTSQMLGSAGKMSVTSTLTGDTKPAMVNLQAATDTTLRFGSGENSFTVSRSSLNLDDIIPGVKMTVSQATAGKSATVHVTQDTSSVKSAITTFVNQYNAFVDFVRDQNSFDSDTNATGTLFGDYRLQEVESQVHSLLFNQVAGLSSTSNSASQIGLSLDSTGKIVVDDTALTNALKSDVASAKRLFITTATSSNTNISYIGSTDSTKVSSAGYSVNISQAATQSHLTLSTLLPASTSQGETLTLNGTSIALTAAMTPSAIMKAINDNSAKTGVTASLTQADGTGSGSYLTLTANAYGSGEHISLVSDKSGDGSLGIGSTTITDAVPGGNTGVVGLDVQGTINGESATGTGQTLTSTSGDATGLQIQVSGITTGDIDSVVFSRGIGSQVNDYISQLTDPLTGSIASAQNTITTKLSNLDDSITRLDASVTATMDRMRAQFSAMEIALGKLQNQSAQISSLIGSMSTSSSSSSS